MVATATLVGFLLVPVAAQVLSVAATDLGLPPDALGRMASELFQAGGIEGMVGKDALDGEICGSVDAQDRTVEHVGRAPWRARVDERVDDPSA